MMARRLPMLGFGLVLLLCFMLLVQRSAGLPPFVFADEWLYSQASRLQPLGDSILPSYLYLALFRATSACGSGFLDCARALNAALFVLAAPFIFLVARRVTGAPAAAVVALASVLAPASSYTAYFMPEASYFFGFWLLAWLVLGRGGEQGPALDWRLGLLAGTALGLLALVKVHALFLLPSLLLYVLWRGWREGTLRAAILCAAVLAATTLAVKTAVAFALAGPPGLNLLGSFYGKHASNSSGNALARLLPPFTRSMYGHLMALGLMFGMPMLAGAAAAVSPAARRALQAPGRNLLVFTVLMLGAALAMTAAFTASIADAGPQEGLRLHVRYYAFLFPLLLVLAAAQLPAAPAHWLHRAALAVPCALLLLWAAIKLPFHPRGFVDSPELVALAMDFRAAWPLLLVQWGAMLAWVARPELGRLAFVGIVLPFLTYTGTQAVADALAASGKPNAYDRAGQYVRQQLGEADRARLSIAGADLAGLSRAQFHIDSASAAAIVLEPGAPLDAAQLPMRRQYLLVVGQHALPAGLAVQAQTPEYALLKLGPAPRTLGTVQFAQPLAGGMLSSLQGLADAEHWGAWSNAKHVTLRFAQPLPKRLALFLNGRAFGPNAGKDFVLSVGGETRSFRLPANEQEIYLALPTDGQQHELDIEIPAPTTPLEAGMGNDKRALGIGIVSLEIAERQ